MTKGVWSFLLGVCQTFTLTLLCHPSHTHTSTNPVVTPEPGTPGSLPGWRRNWPGWQISYQAQMCPVGIVRLYYYSPGTRFGASRPFDHTRSIAFCTFLRHFLGLAWLWATAFFFSLLEKHSRRLVTCSSSVGTRKSPDLGDFHPCRSRQSLVIVPGQSSWPEHRKGNIQEKQSISR